MKLVIPIIVDGDVQAAGDLFIDHARSKPGAETDNVRYVILGAKGAVGSGSLQRESRL